MTVTETTSNSDSPRPLPRYGLLPDLSESAFQRVSGVLQEFVGESGEQARLNPMFCDSIPADLRQDGGEGVKPLILNQFGQPVVKPEKVSVLGEATRSIIRSNLELKEPGVDAQKFVFADIPSDVLQVVPAEQVTRYAKMGFSGLRANSDGSLAPVLMARPLSCVWVNFVTRSGKSWEPNNLTRALLPLKWNRGSAVFPLIGELYLNGEALPDEVLGKLGFGVSGMPVMRAGADGRQVQTGVAPVEWPMFVIGGRGLMLLASMRMLVLQYPDGGVEFALDRYTEGASSAPIPVTGRLCTATAIAFQFTGVGLRRYVYHMAKKTNGKPDLKDGEVIIENDEIPDYSKAALVQRSCYAGKSGIFLDMLHQSNATAPTGGLTTGQLSIERDKLLWRKGARMSGVTFAITTLLGKQELAEAMGFTPDMTAPEIQVAVRAIFDDTHRLDILVPKIKAADSNSSAYSHAFKSIIERDFHQDNRENRLKYLERLGDTLGHNLKILLRCRFAINEEQTTCDNLSIFGGLIDSENLIPMAHRFQALPLVGSFVSDFHQAALAGGFNIREHVEGPAWKAFVMAFLGSSEEIRVHRRILERDAESHDMNEIALSLAHKWVRSNLGKSGRRLASRDLLRFARQDPKARAMLAFSTGLGSSAITELLRHESGELLLLGSLRQERMSIQTFAERFITDIYIIRALQEHRPRALIEANHKPAFQLLRER